MILTKRSTETRANGIAVEASPPMNIRDNRTILLVEDSPEEAELFCEALRIAWDSVASPEYFPRPTVTVRHHAADALEFLRAQAAAHPPLLPALIVLDIDLPGEMSLPFLQALREDLHFDTVPVVAIAWSEEDYAAQWLERVGLSALVPKPLRFEELVGLVDRLCWPFFLSPANLQRGMESP